MRPGFRDGLAATGRDLFARDVGDYSFEGAQAAARRMFDRRKRPDAVFVANDYMAIAAMDVVRFELGLRIPQDISVVSYDDVPQAAWPSYSLTSIRQPTDRMVEAVVEALVAPIEHDDATPHRVLFPGSLIVRGSARVPQGWHDEGI